MAVYYSERRDCEREKRKLQWIFCKLYPFSLLDKIRKDWQLWTYPKLGEPCIYVSLFYLYSFVYYFCIYFIALWSCF